MLYIKKRVGTACCFMILGYGHTRGIWSAYAGNKGVFNDNLLMMGLKVYFQLKIALKIPDIKFEIVAKLFH